MLALRNAATAALFLASTALAQVAIPPHASIYNGFSRGFQFISNTAFSIVQLELPVNAQQVGDTAGFLVRINGAVALHSVANVGPSIATSIAVNVGDNVDIIGNWSPALPGSFTAHNSYTASMASFATTIEGVPHTIQRCGWQHDIGVSPLTGVYLAPTSGAMGRINVYTSSASGTLATNTTTGQGCIADYTSIFEEFTSAASFDLANTAITFTAAGPSKLVSLGGAFLPVGSVQAVPTVLALGDDSAVTQAFTVGSFPGAAGGLTVCSNGFVSLAPGNGTTFTPVVATMLNDPQTSYRSWHDFNVTIAGSGQVKWEESASLTMITWDGVWDYGGTSVADASNLQFQFYANGDVVIAWGAMSLIGASGTGHVVGYSPGGTSLNPGASNLSALVPTLLEGQDNLPLGLVGVTRPIINTNWDLQTTNIPATGVIGLDIVGLVDPAIPDMGFLGMPTCQLRATLDNMIGPWVVTGATHNFAFFIPNSPALVNMHVFRQSAVFQLPPVNAFGAITSNGIDGKIGDF
ncbi:MAG TPA: hypothetical protein VF384_11815 [Planctomycetota bacterium]